MRALHALPDGRSDTVAETTTLPEFPQGEVDTAEVIDLITERLDVTVGTVRDVHDDVDDEDPTSADILHGVLERLEQLSWMVSAETASPAPPDDATKTPDAGASGLGIRRSRGPPVPNRGRPGSQSRVAPR